jgi:hypothetical protein
VLVAVGQHILNKPEEVRVGQRRSHAGEADVAGDIVFQLTSPTEGTVSGCAAADAAFIEALTSNPQGYYVNVHNEEYPEGALRGQLGE